MGLTALAAEPCCAQILAFSKVGTELPEFLVRETSPQGWPIAKMRQKICDTWREGRINDISKRSGL